MQHTLYRKHRPAKFDEVFGQENVVKTLQAFIKNDSLPHAYLFIGSRGIGKTSLARIFDNSLNIKNEDITEIDAASNRGIDDIRELRDSVYTWPALSKYKLYIIDEVHMLTKEAFNALLKTLEEPPEHCLFILATTEREKVPDTIVSRCQQINFETPTNEIVAKFVLDVAKKEGKEISKETAAMVARNARGAFRDALTLLQQILDILDAYAAADEKLIIKSLEAIKKTNTKPIVFLDSFIDAFRACMLYRLTKGDTQVVDLGHLGINEKDIEKIVNKKPEVFQSKNLIKLLDVFETARHATYPWVYIEAVLLEDK